MDAPRRIGHGAAVLAGLAIALIAGLSARWLLRVPRPGIVVAAACGVVGMVIGAPIVHAISGEHEFHAFRPESFIAALLTALVLLLLYRRISRRPDAGERRLFS
ncbi:GlsB/YeaQ/YmgE family stress response membrane protein [Paraconexibacter antarcticus]|uniref:GlsB/YeaQ/YmgE family stress response membrane protein n=1 Tax=Paraconexibacter antarcticus TaxID=2949664 RepID=A0ABY5DS01_9ACTN|nr:GlsB/YeaQ/YmgE family stress response membrane protein [Paraconexibacter antarcticus]UTI63354.1 GlsB/YeaQ/YmgE family stress response membrane protein [Paraconexibacter antarcticus]